MHIWRYHSTRITVKNARPKSECLSMLQPGNKKDNVTVIYTPWSNLRKDASMATGQVSFKDPKKVGLHPNISSFLLPSLLSIKESNPTSTHPAPQPPFPLLSSLPSSLPPLQPTSPSKPPRASQQVKKSLVPTRTNASINRLEKTRTLTSASDLPAAKETYLKQQRVEKRKLADAHTKEENRIMQERRREKEEKERAWEELRTGGEGGGKSNAEGWDEDDFM